MMNEKYIRCWNENVNCPVVVDGNIQLFSDEWRLTERYVSASRFAYAVYGLIHTDVALVVFQMIKGNSFIVCPRQYRSSESLARMLAERDHIDRLREYVRDLKEIEDAQ